MGAETTSTSASGNDSLSGGGNDSLSGQGGADTLSEADQARAVVPADAASYKLNVSDALKPFLGDLETDPMLGALREHYAATGKNQGALDDLFGALDVMREKGLLQPAFDAQAELTKLGENGQQRRAEVETFANALKERGDIDADEHAELMSLAPTAAGVRVIEKLRKLAGPNGDIKLPTVAAGGGDAAQEEARALRRDARYETDRDFRKMADAKWLEAFKG